MLVLTLSDEFEDFELFGREVHRHDPLVLGLFVQRVVVGLFCKERSLLCAEVVS